MARGGRTNGMSRVVSGCRVPYDAETPSRPRTGLVHVPLRWLDAWARDGPVGRGGCAHGDRDVRARQQDLRRLPGRQGSQPRDRRRRVHGPGRTVRLRQDDQPADDRRPRGDHQRHAPDRRPRRQRRPAQGSRHRDGLPELRALPAHVGPREPRVRAQAAQGPQGRDRAPGQRGRRDHPARASCSIASPRSCPAASASASRSVARSCASRRCS